MAKIRHTPGPGAKALGLAIKGLKATQGRVGWFESAKYENGTPVAGVAYVQEHGSPAKKIPPRPFMRTTAAEQKESWAQISRQLSKAVVNGQLQPEAILEGLTQRAEGDIRRTISKVSTPPLSPKTIAARARRHSKRKASSKPLVDTAVMLNTITSQVIKK